MTTTAPFARIARLANGAFTALAAVFILLIAVCSSLLPLPAAAAGTLPITVSFDHLSTGFELDGVHRDLPCESCHLNAVFKGTPRNCGMCHITGSVYNATPKTATHIMSTNNCAACHDTIAFLPGVHFDHHEVMGSCVTCHNGTIAQGKDLTKHPKTNDACEACHTVMSWNPPKAVDHAQIPLSVAGFCIICHDGVGATGKNKGHVVTTLECGDCHLTSNWMGAAFDHTGLRTGCASCHNGVKAVGKQGAHMPTTNTCENCHTTGIGTKSPSWVPSAFDHTQMTTVNSCLPCHSGTVKISTGHVSGLPVNHVPLSSATPDCVLCHGNNPAAETWMVLAADIPTLHTKLNTANCLMCHGSETFAGVPAPFIPMSILGVSPYKKAPLAPPHIPILAGTDCSACHSAAYQAGGFGPATAMSAAKHAFVSTTCDTCHDSGKSYYVGSGAALQLRPANHINSSDPRMATSDCAVCHETTDWNSTAMPAGHMPNPSNLSCVTCHASAPSDYTAATLAPNAVLHKNISGNCGLCHGNTVSALTWANNFTPKDALLAPSHIPYLSGTDCSSCHASTNYAVGGFGPTNMSLGKHAFVPTSCNTCHEAGLSFTMGVATPSLQGRPADHTTGRMAAPNDCSICHSPANWNSTVLPDGHMPNPANTACAVCHTAAPSSYAQATLAANAILHTGIGGNCGQCHGATAPLTWYNNYTPKDAVLTPAHMPYIAGSDCASCHTSSTFAVGSFGPMNMTQATHSFVPTTCNICHESGVSIYMGAASPALQGRPADHTTGNMLAPNDCSVCHTTANWNSNALPVGHMPLPGTQTCNICHVGNLTTTAGYATLAAIPILHTGITGSCGQCHGATGALTWYNNYTPKDGVLSPPHIPYTAGTDCGACHASTYTAGGFGPTNMSAAKHAFVPTTCATCHETGLTFYLGTSTPTLQGRPADHISSGDAQQKTGDCSICHNPVNWLSTALPIGHMPNPGNQACGVCHTAIDGTFAGYATLTTNMTAMHTGIAVNCAQCHGSAAGQLTFFNNNENPKAAVLAPSHIPYLSGTDCSSCHVVGTTFGPTQMSAAKHAFVPTACDSCHEAGLNFYMGASTPALQGRPTSHQTSSNPQEVSGDCSSCHNTTDWTTTAKPANHIPTPGTQTCSVCHVAIGTTEASYAALARVSLLHTGITGSCALCHGNTTVALTWYNNYTPKDAILAPTHIPYSVGTDCSSCHAANYVTGGFGPINMSAAKHAFVPTTCDTCHEAGRSFYLGASTPVLQGRPANHVSTPNPPSQATGDCSLCHNTTLWTTPTTLPDGHMPIPGTQVCSVCHVGNLNTIAGYGPKAAIPTLHSGITTGCAQCHGGATQLVFVDGSDNPKAAASLPLPHIPSFAGNDCSACHTTNYALGGFGPMNMTQATHTNVSTTACKTCHEAGLSFYMGAASPGLQGRPADHTSANMAAPNDCTTCHTTANWNSTALPAGHMPNPANTACNTCHTAAPTNYVTLAANAVLHTGIVGNCGQCHGNTTTALTWYKNFTPKDAVLAPSHIPYIAGTDCANCHASTTYAVGTFGPLNMTQARHSFVPATCVTCHETGKSFYMGAASPALQLRPADHTAGQMLTGDCSACHTTANWNSTTLPAGHMPNPAGVACTVCHTTAPADYTPATLAANSVLHTNISGSCGTCHGATTALTWYNNYTPKDAVLAPKHIPYLSATDCSSCHVSSTYAAGTFGPMNMTQSKHVFVPTTCNTCHEAGLSFYLGASTPGLQGRPADHTSGNMVAPNDCSACHTTANWNSTVLPAGHMPNPANVACAVCHANAPTDYTPATLAANSALHTGISGGCATCHGATTALTWYNNYTPKDAVLAPPHIPFLSSTDCSSCHASSTYAAGTFGPMNMTQAKHSFVGGTCVSCHEAGKSFYMGAASPGLQGRPADHTSGQMVAPNDCSICHTTANWNSTALPAGHMPNPGNQACAVCHTAAPTNYTTLAANSVLHTGISGNCGQCHGGTSALTWYKNFTPKDAVLSPSHIPFLAGTDCSSCHASSSYAAGGFGPMNMTQAKHSFVTTNCIACHEKGVSLYMGAASPGLQGRPADHTSGQMLAPNDCSICHTTANWNSTSLPAGHMPNPGNQGCAVCHTAAPSNYVPLASHTVLHTGISSGCSTCHGAPNAAAPVFYRSFTPKDALLSPPHIPSGNTSCESCHSNAAFTSFAGVTMDANKHTAMFNVIGGSCDACHDSPSLRFYGVNNLTTRPNGHHVGQDCKGCHSPNQGDWGGGRQSKKTAAATAPRSTVGLVSSTGLQSQRLAVASTGANNLAASRAGRGGVLANAGVAGIGGGASISHLGVVSNCASCHNGVLASGKGATHVASNTACENCHTTIAWLPARFDHRGITASCASCHNGVQAPGKPARHVQTAQDCSKCHGTIAWEAVSFSHIGINATCQSCHNGITATGKQVQHVATTLDCATCHNTMSWTVPTTPAKLKPLLPRGPSIPPAGHVIPGPNK